VNILITIILAFFTILGLLGVGGIWKIASSFRNELNELIALKGKFETKFAEIEAGQEEASNRLREITEVNKEQDERLELLEIQEYSGLYIDSGDYTKALEFITGGLQKYPNDSYLKSLHLFCLIRLKKYPEALNKGHEYLETESDNTGIV